MTARTRFFAQRLAAGRREAAQQGRQPSPSELAARPGVKAKWSYHTNLSDADPAAWPAPPRAAEDAAFGDVADARPPYGPSA